MAGVTAHALLGAVSPVGPASAFNAHMKILRPFPKSTWKFWVRHQNPPKYPLLAPKAQPSVWIGRAQAEIVRFSAEVALPYVAGKVGDVLIKEASLFFGVHEEVEWIKNELEYMQCFLEDADSKQNTNALVKKWVSDIRDVSYEVEDVIDNFVSNETAERRKLGTVEYLKSKVNQKMTHQEINKEIGRLKQKINDITRRRESYGIRDINEGRQEARSSSTPSLHERRRFSAEVEEPEVVGHEEEINTLREQLISEEPSRCVISIVGMGGSGKTTLAKKVYHDVKDVFDCHAFICLSQQYGIKDVLMRIIKRVMGLPREEMEKLTQEELGVELRDHLKNKRYLVVIDDIWSKKAWDEMLKLILPNVKNKSRVVLTTRHEEVVPYHPPLRMRPLNGDEGRELFLKKIFEEGNPSMPCPTTYPSGLEEIGKKLLARCGGLPLAILLLGGLLASKDKTFREWSDVLRIASRYLIDGTNQCGEMLALSYWDLPHYLKPCFLYLGLFPEDYEIDSVKLIRLWIAEGFIQQRGDEIMEDKAEKYLEELVSRSMIQASSKRSDGLVGGFHCHIHDLLRELSISRAKENNFFTIHDVDGSTLSFPNNMRRLALHRSIDGYHPTETLRSILNFDLHFDLSQLDFRQAKLLRVVCQKYLPGKVIEEVRGFVHLKYLELSASKSIPSSIGDLCNLQTLVFNTSDGLLPSAISNLEQLRHLESPGDSAQQNLLVNKLTNLQTLCLMADSWLENGFGKLTNLRVLEINGITRFHNEKLISHSIYKLKNLRSLSLQSWSSLPSFMPFTDHLHLYRLSLTGMIYRLSELPPNLAELHLSYSKLREYDISTLKELPQLKFLKLSFNAFISKKMIFSSGGFFRLELLELICLPLKELIVEEGAMPSLKSIVVYDMPNLTIGTLPKQVRVHRK